MFFYFRFFRWSLVVMIRSLLSCWQNGISSSQPLILGTPALPYKESLTCYGANWTLLQPADEHGAELQPQVRALEHSLKQTANPRHVFRSQLGKILLSTLILCCQTMATWMESCFRPGEPIIRALKDYLDRLDCPGWQPDVAQRCLWSTRRDAALSLRLLSPCWTRFGRVSARATELC